MGWQRSPGGLVSALEAGHAANDGTWIGWPGGTEQGLEPFEDQGMQLVPMSLTAEEIEEFCGGFSNATLWPLYHDVVAKPEFHRGWWDSYVAVNRRFAERAAEVAAGARDGLGARLPAAAGAGDAAQAAAPGPADQLLLHIPFPAAGALELRSCRGVRQILEGLLGADLVGFQLGGAAQNFVRLVRQRVGHKTHRDLVYLPDGRTVRAAAFPISIDVDLRSAGPLGGGHPARQGRSAGGRQPAQDLPGRRPPRLHQGHLRPPAGVRRSPRGGTPRRRGRTVFVQGGHAPARTGRAVPHPA